MQIADGDHAGLLSILHMQKTAQSQIDQLETEKVDIDIEYKSMGVAKEDMRKFSEQEVNN